MGRSCPGVLGSLHCVRETAHTPDAGCVYVASSAAPDQKADDEQQLEELYA